MERWFHGQFKPKLRVLVKLAAVVEQVAPGLWRWTAEHPQWQPDWLVAGAGRDVGSVAHERGDVLAVFDPMVAPGVLEWLDGVAAGRSVAVLLTAPWHERGTEEVRRRYGARVFAARWALPHLRCEVTDVFERGGELLPGVVAVPLRGIVEPEVPYLLPERRALVVAEVFVGADDGLRVARDPSVRDDAAWRASLAELCALDVEHVLPAHGRPVLGRGGEEMRAALTRPEWNSGEPLP